MAPIDHNWKKPTVSPEMVTLVKDINLSDRELDRWYDKDRFLDNFDVKFGGYYIDSNVSDISLGENEPFYDVRNKLLKAWHKAYESDIPKYDNLKQSGMDRDMAELDYVRKKYINDKFGSIKIYNNGSYSFVYDGLSPVYKDPHYIGSIYTGRYCLLNPIYNKVGNWWVGDKGQPIMWVSNNAGHYGGEPVIPKSYNDYLVYTDADKKNIEEFKALSAKGNLSNDETERYTKLASRCQGTTFVNRSHMIPGLTWAGSMDVYNPDAVSIRDLTPLEFMSPYNPDVLVPEAKLNELAKEHPEVWEPMIFECDGYRSICVSENGYIISAYQPAPNVFLPIHIYGVSDHRGPTGYDAEKSIIITVNKFHDDPDHKEKLYEADDRGDEVTEAEVHKAYERMIEAS